MFNKTRLRIAALEAHNARLEAQIEVLTEKNEDLRLERDGHINRMRAARATAVRARSNYISLTMPYQHMTNVILTLDGKVPLS